MIDSNVTQSLKISDHSGRSISFDLPTGKDGFTLSMRQGDPGEPTHQFIYYGLTRRQALIIGQFLTEYGKGESAVDADTEGGDA